MTIMTGVWTVGEGVTTLPEEDAILPVEAIGNRNRPVPGTLVLGRRGDASDASRLFFVVGADAGKRGAIEPGSIDGKTAWASTPAR